MEDEINQLRVKLETLERQKKDEEERNKDPFRYLRERIQTRTTELFLEDQKYRRNGHTIAFLTREIECDKSILQALLELQTEVKSLRAAHVKPRVRSYNNEVDIRL